MARMSTQEASNQANTQDDFEGLDAFKPSPMLAPTGAPPEAGIGARLQAARNHYRLSVDALARLTKTYDSHEGRGISATALLRYEASAALPGTRELRLLSESLGVESDWLIFGLTPGPTLPDKDRQLLAATKLFLRMGSDAAVGEDGSLLKYQEQIQRRDRIADIKR